MAGLEALEAQMANNPKGVRYLDLCKLCDAWFGQPRQSSGSHRVYQTPWQGDPRINIQNHGGKAKPYQVRQVLKAIALIRQRDGKYD